MSHDIEDQLRQYFRDTTTTVGGSPNLVSNAVHTGRVRRRRHRSAAVGAAVAASLGLVIAVPIIQSAMGPDRPASSVPASVPALPQIVTSSWQRGDSADAAAMKGRLSLSTDGRCLVVGPTGGRLVVWPKGYSVVLRDGQVTVLDEAGAEVARVGDVIDAGGGFGDVPANSCGLGEAFYIQSKVSRTHP